MCRDMKVKVMEKGAQVLNNIPARRLDEIIDNRQVELPVSKTEKLSLAPRDNAIVIHFGVLVEDVSHLLFKAEPF